MHMNCHDARTANMGKQTNIGTTQTNKTTKHTKTTNNVPGHFRWNQSTSTTHQSKLLKYVCFVGPVFFGLRRTVARRLKYCCLYICVCCFCCFQCVYGFVFMFFFLVFPRSQSLRHILQCGSVASAVASVYALHNTSFENIANYISTGFYGQRDFA